MVHRGNAGCRLAVSDVRGTVFLRADSVNARTSWGIYLEDPRCRKEKAAVHY